MNDKLFISQAILDRWIDAGKVVFEAQILTLIEEKKAYTLTPAVRFMSVVAGEDVVKLLGKVRPIEKLKELGAEHMQDSVIIGDNAYEVQEGFVAIVLAAEPSAAEPEAPAKKSASAPAPVAAAPVQTAPAPALPAESMAEAATRKGDEQANDADLLTKFLLNNLNF